MGGQKHITFVEGLDDQKEKAKEEAWFEWAEMTCYEFFMEELGGKHTFEIL